MTNQVSKILVVLLVLTFLKGLAWVFVTPIFHAPDEPQHYSYVQYLVEHKRAPQLKELDFEPSERLAKQMEILEVEQIAHNAHIQHSYYRSASDVHPHLELAETSNLDPKPSELNYIHNYGPVYYALNVPAYLTFEPSLPSQVYAMRIISVLLSCITVWLVFATVRRVYSKHHFPALVALLFTLQPQFSFISASVNSDNLIVLWFTLFFYLIVNWWGKNLSLKRVLALVLLGFLAFMTKTQGILLCILIFAYLLIDLLKRFDWKKVIMLSVATLVGVVASASIFFEQILKVFFNNDVASSYFTEHGVLWFLKTITFTRLFRTYKSFWGRYGWLDTLMPEWAYYLLFVLMLAGLIGLVLYFVRQHKKPLAKMLGFLLFSILLVDFTYTALFAKNAILFEYYNFPIQGRYYFIVLLPILLLMGWGLISLVKDKWQKYVMYGAVYLVLFVHVVSLFAIIPIRYYL